MTEPSLVQGADNLPRLAVTATNEYGEYDRASLALYGLDMLVEPYRETTLATRRTDASTATLFRWRVVEVDASGLPLEASDPALDVRGGPDVTVTLTMPGTVYLLTVEEQNSDGAVLAEGRATVSCRYVRREIRDLTDADRTDFLDAMETYYTVSDEEGQALYGEDFFNYNRLSVYHNVPVSEVFP